MTIYEEVLKNKDYLDIMDKIGEIKLITDGKWDWEHGIGHANRVASYAQKFLLQLNADKRIIDLGMTAALLHDIGLIKGDKIDHALESSNKFDVFIKNTDITEEEKLEIRNAIADHSKGNNITSLVGLALVLADKLDVTYHRTVDSSIQDKMNKEIQKIREVNIVISEEVLFIKYRTVRNFDINILNDWDKAITIPQKVALYLNKDFVFMINNKQIEL